MKAKAKAIRWRKVKLARVRVRGRRGNPSAAELTEAFHGRPAEEIADVVETEYYDSEVADLGELKKLVIESDTYEYSLRFTGDTRVTCTPDGKQLELIGGDQQLAVSEFGISANGKRIVPLGDARVIVYLTSKDFHNFEPTEYEHEFGEDGGELPFALYDVRNQKILLAGGSYVVKRPGIIN
jgi:hypothetical protein